MSDFYRTMNNYWHPRILVTNNTQLEKNASPPDLISDSNLFLRWYQNAWYPNSNQYLPRFTPPTNSI